jgi:hypothetical protein
MLLSSHSLEFKAVLICAWIFPYVFVALQKRNWVKWAEGILTSITSVFLFVVSFIVILLIHTDFWRYQKGFETLPDIFAGGIVPIMIIFPGLTIIISMTFMAALLKRSFTATIAFGGFAIIGHVLYPVSIVYDVFEIPIGIG